MFPILVFPRFQCLRSFFSSGIEHKNDIYSCAQLEANNNNEVPLVECSIQSKPIGPEVKHEPSPTVVNNETVVKVVVPLPSELHQTKDQIPTTTITHQEKCIKPVIINPPSSVSHQSTTATFVKEHRPRSVTASVFAPVTADNITPQLVALQLQSQRSTVAGGVQSSSGGVHQLNHHKTNGVNKPHQLVAHHSPIQATTTGGVLLLPSGNNYQSPKDQRSNGSSRGGGTAMNKGFMMFLDDGNDSKCFFYYMSKMSVSHRS